MDIFRRCDNKNDCHDGSDEKDCKILRVPASYDYSIPPESEEGKKVNNDIFTHVDIINVDEVNTVDMMVALTIRLTFKWKDHRVEFLDVKNSKKDRLTKVIPNREKGILWTPLNELVHDNAVIGRIKEVDFYNLGVRVENDALVMDSSFPTETLVYPGKENPLIISQRMKISYQCKFSLVTFPFDSSICDFHLSLRTAGNISIRLTNDETSIVYNGSKTLNEFEIGTYWSRTSHSETKTTFTYSIQFHRLYEHHLSTTFFQSFILWVLAYVTIFIKLDDFSNQFMGAVTALLVLASLMSTLNGMLPKTAYFKYIDIWFNWYIGNIFMIILIHVIIDYVNENEDDMNFLKKSNAISSISFLQKVDASKIKCGKPGFAKKINQIFKIALPCVNFLFICFYFTANSRTEF